MRRPIPTVTLPRTSAPGPGPTKHRHLTPIPQGEARHGGTHMQRPIPTVTLPRTSAPRPGPTKHRHLTPIPREPRSTVPLPSLLLTNPTNLTNKFDELSVVVKQEDPDIIAISETWFSVNKPAHQYEINGYDLFHKNRDTRGGGVCLYARKHLQAVRAQITVPPHLECLWVHLKKCKTSVPNNIVCAVLSPRF